MNHETDQTLENAVKVVNAAGSSSVLLVCEHATSYMPPEFDNLGLPKAARESHVAWDPGALAVAHRISERLDAVLIAGVVSRLIYDLNRPPQVEGAMPVRSELTEVPGNQGLSEAEKNTRVDTYYTPFHKRIGEAVAQADAPIIVTMHSFTPVYHGKTRAVEIGVLHDDDSRLADAALALSANHLPYDVQRNEPYGPEDGVTHTLQKHGVAGAHLNVMIEIRNDLIADTDSQTRMGDMIANWLVSSCLEVGAGGVTLCQA